MLLSRGLNSLDPSQDIYTKNKIWDKYKDNIHINHK